MTTKRLIEVAFPLKQTSMDSVHEKNVRHGHISTLHIWPARRPLAASRAALIATLATRPWKTRKSVRSDPWSEWPDESLRRLESQAAERSNSREEEGGDRRWHPPLGP